MVTGMRTSYQILIAISIAVLFIFLTGAAYADILIKATPELVGVSTTTSMTIQGTATTGTTMSLQLGSDALNNPPLENGGYMGEYWLGPDGSPIIGYTMDPWVASIIGTPAPPGEVQYTAGYNEMVTAVSGNLIYQKMMGVSTTTKSGDEYNIVADGIVSFKGGGDGRMTTGEDLLIDGTGAQTVATDRVLCPFTAVNNPFFPPFCNIVVSGSTADISTGSVSTVAGGRLIAASSDVPGAETYNIDVKGFPGSGGYSDANGTVSTFMKAHLQEGIEQQIPRMFDTDPLGFIPVRAEDVSYSETSTASGSIGSFNKEMKYQSGLAVV